MSFDWKSAPIFASVSHQTWLDTRSKARRPIKVGIKERGRSGTSRPRTLLVYVAHRLTWCNVSLMSQIVSRTQRWVQARIPGCGLNQTARSSAIHRLQKESIMQLAHPELNGLKSAIVPFVEPRCGPKSRTGSRVLFRKSAPSDRLVDIQQ